MKRAIVFGWILLTLSPALPPSNVQARPSYCDVALIDCARKCKARMPILWEGCVVGCELGYLFCGGSPF
jgi:hypothetical protein